VLIAQTVFHSERGHTDRQTHKLTDANNHQVIAATTHNHSLTRCLYARGFHNCIKPPSTSGECLHSQTVIESVQENINAETRNLCKFLVQETCIKFRCKFLYKKLTNNEKATANNTSSTVNKQADQSHLSVLVTCLKVSCVG